MYLQQVMEIGKWPGLDIFGLKEYLQNFILSETVYYIIFTNFSTQLFFRVHVEESSAARGLDLVFRSIESSDEGEYSCEATIDGQKEQQFFYLKVIGKMFFNFFLVGIGLSYSKASSSRLNLFRL